MGLTIRIENQPVELYNTETLQIFHDKTKKTDNFILATFFGNEVGFADKDYVVLDELETSVPLAPFVSHNAQAKPLALNTNFERGVVKAPYLKPSITVTPDSMRDGKIVSALRSAGVISQKSLSKAEVFKVAQAKAFQKLRESIDNRKILMAVDILTTGKTLCVGDDYPAYEIDFKRDNALSFTPAVKWNEPNATPVTDIEKMMDVLIDKSGTSAKVIISSSAVFNCVVKNEEFKERFVKPNGANTPSPFEPMLSNSEEVQYRGELGGVKWFTYDTMHNLMGVAKRFIDRTGFYLISNTQGYTAHCMIKNLDVLGEPLPYYDSQVILQDPSGLKMICESSPLLLPDNPNGVAGGTGFID